jgi:hypothetical protein
LSEFDKNDGDGSGSNGSPAAASKAAVEPKKPATAKTEVPSDLFDMVKQLHDRETERIESERRREFQADMKETVKQIRGELAEDIASDRLVRAWIDGMAEDNPKLANAWVNRKNDPKQFARIVEGLSREFHKEFSRRPDPRTSEDRELVSAAVRGASTKAPEDRPPSYGTMSDSEFAATIEKQFKFRPF